MTKDYLIRILKIFIEQDKERLSKKDFMQSYCRGRIDAYTDSLRMIEELKDD